MTRVCKTCKTEKAITEFGLGKTYAGGRLPHCKVCRNAYSRAWATPEKTREYHLKHTYGIADESVLGERKCGICGTTDGRLHVDHCHTTGQVRGLLCRTCNIGLGHFKDSPELLGLAAAYLNQRR